MCGRVSLGADAATLAAQFDLFEAPAWTPRYNIAPTQPAPSIVIASADLRWQFKLHRWGLIPSWAKDPGIGAQMINAQAETVANKPAFRAAFRKRRCLVLADGFYEWAHQGRQKQPYYIRLRDGRPFAISALWEHWEGAGGTPITSCTLLTIAANDLIGAFHHRMPVILDSEHYDLWLDPSVQDPARLQPLLRSYPAHAMSASPSSDSKPASTSSPGPICPTVRPSTSTCASRTRCTTTRIAHVSMTANLRAAIMPHTATRCRARLAARTLPPAQRS